MARPRAEMNQRVQIAGRGKKGDKRVIGLSLFHLLPSAFAPKFARGSSYPSFLLSPFVLFPHPSWRRHS